MSNDLVSQNNSLTQNDEHLQNLLADFSLPKITIGMGSPQKGKVGHFNFSTGESLPILEKIVVLGVVKGWVLYGGKGKKPARCASDDGQYPAIRIANPVSQSCLSCPANRWGEDPKKDEIMEQTGQQSKGEKPICNNTRSITLANADGIPMVLVVKTHNAKIVDDFLSLGVVMNSKKLGVKPLGCALDIALESMPGEGNRYKMKFQNWRALTPDEIIERQGLFELFGGGRAGRVVSEIHAKQDQENANFDESDIPF